MNARGKTLDQAHCPRCGTTRPHLVARTDDIDGSMERRICMRCDNVLDTPRAS